MEKLDWFKPKEKIVLSDYQLQILYGKVCPYCKNRSEYVDSKEIYGVSYGMIYLCRKCNAYVGVHEGTNNAKGRLANNELRKLKIEAHKAFDELWMSGQFKRKEAYIWLSHKLQLPEQFCHLGMLGSDKLKDVIFYSKQVLQDMKDLDKNFIPR